MVNSESGGEIQFSGGTILTSFCDRNILLIVNGAKKFILKTGDVIDIKAVNHFTPGVSGQNNPRFSIVDLQGKDRTFSLKDIEEVHITS